MYQSFPQNFYTEKSSAMPIAQPKAVNDEPRGIPQTQGLFKIFDSLSLDDIILIGLVILLLTEGNDEWLLIGLLIFLFIQ